MLTYRALIFIAFVIVFFGSSSSFALAPNPGAVCPANFSKGNLTNPDYTDLVSNIGNYVNVAGNSANSIPLQIRMTVNERTPPPTTGSFNSVTIGSDGAFNIVRDFPSLSSVTSVDLEFRNSITTQPIFLTNVALSAFDIDFVDNSANSFDDYVLFSGVTASGNTIDGTYQAVTGSNIRVFTDTRTNTPGQGLYTLGNVADCAGDNLDTACQGSVQFSEPVKSVKVRYANAAFRASRTDPTNQQIFLRLDNYCYVPQYIFSGTVFDDNGGITAAQASATNADITSGIYANNTNYFNGVFNAPLESGIAGSTVRLANCSNTSTTYPTQSVIRSDAPLGEYQISIPRTTLGSNTDLCLVESRTGTTYPLRTNSDRITIPFIATTYNYPNNNFGRVIAENVALVLKKQQYVNDCPPTLNYASINETATPTAGFSTANISNVTPGKCIAYKITATNRANVAINDFIMRDILQLKGVNGATVTSFLANPALSTTDYTATENPAIGTNGEIKTKTFVLNPRTKRDFYFNTKYGTTQ